MTAVHDALWTIYRVAVRLIPHHPAALTMKAEDALSKQAWGHAFDLSHEALRRRTDFPPALFVRGVARLHLDDYRGALFDFNRYLASVEQPPSVVYYWRARLYITREEWTLAQRDLERILERNQRNPHILYWYAFVVWQRREWDKLEKTLGILESLAPNMSGLWELWGHYWLSKGNDFLAERAYTRALTLGIHTPDLYYNRAIARRHLGELEAARQDVQAILTTDPHNPWAHVEMSTLAFTVGDYELALQHARTAKAQAPSLFEAHFCTAASLAALGYRDQAVKFLNEMRQHFPHHPKADSLLGDLLAEEGQSAAAAALYEAVLEAEPDNRTVQLKLAGEWLALDRFDTAEDLLNELVAESPECPDARSLRADLYRYTNRPNLMRQELDQLIVLDPDDANAYMYRAMHRYYEGDMRGAKADLDRGITVDRSNGWVWAYRGLWHLRSGNLRGAREDFQQAITLAPENAWIRRQWATFLIQSNHTTQAGKILDALIADDPDDGFARLMRAEVHLLMGELSAAEQQCFAIIEGKQETEWLAHAILAVLATTAVNRNRHLRQAEATRPEPTYWGVSAAMSLAQQALLECLRGNLSSAETALQQAILACKYGETLWRALPPLFTLLEADSLADLSTPLLIPVKLYRL
jgi:tetratricopeptide (TPR) repeat protein